ncbi:26S proteasome regulatory subunit 2, putative [Theileria equi strain WA]|uniref:26S proteasome regulatory subunit 2, putative n=1 Tax=Theileria equi strain WA TaxID=1537102 RepID=L1LEL1_THEEQ|nr:26S proteasome regulatory subunit 2, putative [Theileria equi strain WA]EKX73719.1 26S proteasome regulatory subunit 2, putative [Theileria equi strain WA]|eukprot:XP_004833171.1 26S proteasome regulatory subunit 2, putative [Theileria equi strain WA]
MSSKSKDNLSEADLAYKDELDALVNDLLNTDLCDPVSVHILSNLVNHATSDAGNISSLPKALQFLIEHKVALDEFYKRYSSKNGEDCYSLILLLELVSFLEAINISDEKKNSDADDTIPLLLSSFKLLLYKLEANVIADRMLSLPLTDDIKSKLTSRKISDWGNEYLISLSAQLVSFYSLSSIRNEYSKISSFTLIETTEVSCKSLIKEQNITMIIVESLKAIEALTTYWLQNGFEFDAIDLLLEVDRIESIYNKCSNDYDLVTRVSTYLSSIASYAATPLESQRILTVTYDLLLNNDRSAEALRIALKLNDFNKVHSLILSCKNSNVRKQLAFICAGNGIHLNYTMDDLKNIDSSLTEADLEELNNLSSGEHLSGFFLNLCQELDVLDPKHPSEVFKGYPTKSNLGVTTQLGQTISGVSIDSAKENLAHSFVNGFVNCGFGTDLLLKEDGSNWIFKHQEAGLLCAAASVGLLNLWNIDEGLSQIDKYQYSSDSNIKAGAFAAFGLASCGVVSESDPVAGLLMDQIDNQNPTEKLGAILGLGFGYAGSCRENILEILIPCIIDESPSNTLECSVFSAISLGLIFVGTGNQEAAEAIIQTLIEKELGSPQSLDSPLSTMYACALGLLQIGRMEACEPLIEALSALQHPFGKFAITTVESFAFAGSGDVLRIQKLLKCCVGHDAPTTTVTTEASDGDVDMEGNSEPKKETTKVGFAFGSGDESTSGSAESSIAILGISLISLSEQVGSAMIARLVEHPLQCGSPYERRAVPLALALVNVSNPNPQVIGMLSKLTHDTDKDVCLHAILALGIVGAGTNNSRINVLLQNIARCNSRDMTLMFVLRLAVGLLFMGKGTTTLTPLRSEGFLLNKVALGGLLVVLMASLNLRNTIVDKMPYVLLYVALAIKPRWLITLTPDLELLQIPVRVGNIVETIGTAGKQRKISGFQTHKTPVLVGVAERAELANEEYISCTPFLEGIVIVEKNLNANIDATYYG